jgi:hypothetical protein
MSVSATAAVGKLNMQLQVDLSVRLDRCIRY